MSLETHSTKRNRVYKRKFDHDLAREMWDKGFNVNEIRRHLGNVVTPAAIARVVDPRVRKQMDAKAREFLMSGVCTKCGAPRHKYLRNENDPGICRKCWGEAKQTRFKLNEDGDVIAVRCGRCEQWKDPILFGTRKRASRGIAQRCRQCETRARGAYRQRHKEPCVFCGAPALPYREKGPSAVSYPRCRDCFHAGRILLPDVV